VKAIAGGAASDEDIDDRGARLLGIPFFGLAITHLSGVLGPLGPASPLYWAGCLWFILLSAILWHVNRAFLLRRRGRPEAPPRRAVALLLAANVSTAAPLSVLMHALWFRFSRLPWDGRQVAVTTAVIVLAVAFVTHVYETVHLIRQRERDLVKAERLDRARLEAELHALKSQVDPHFLYNALHSLAFLIPRDAGKAALFAQRLGEVYLYILTHREQNLVPLRDELRFAAGYVELLRVRFGDSVRLVREGDVDLDRCLIPPVSLQVLLENAVKHNPPRAGEVLEMKIGLHPDRLEVTNRRLGSPGPAGPGVGLANLDDRYRRIVGRGLEVHEDEGAFKVVLPLVRPG
jgi:hypothetical protein